MIQFSFVENNVPGVSDFCALKVSKKDTSAKKDTKKGGDNVQIIGVRPKKIGKIQARTLAETVIEFFADEKNMKEFEEWKVKRYAKHDPNPVKIQEAI